MDGRPYQRNKAGFSNSSGVVQTGPKEKDCIVLCTKSMNSVKIKREKSGFCED